MAFTWPALAVEPALVPVYEGEGPAPVAPKTTQLVWRFGVTNSEGWWLPDAQARKVLADLNACNAAANVVAQPQFVPWWGWLVTGLVGGSGIGWYLHR